VTRSISSFDIGRDGSARLRNATAFKPDPELLIFSDLAVSVDGRSLFQLVGNTGQVTVFDTGGNGDLSLRQTLDGLPRLGAYGLLVLSS
jgi:hypothetical protein